MSKRIVHTVIRHKIGASDTSSDDSSELLYDSRSDSKVDRRLKRVRNILEQWEEEGEVDKIITQRNEFIVHEFLLKKTPQRKEKAMHRKRLLTDEEEWKSALKNEFKIMRKLNRAAPEHFVKPIAYAREPEPTLYYEESDASLLDWKGSLPIQEAIGLVRKIYQCVAFLDKQSVITYSLAPDNFVKTGSGFKMVGFENASFIPEQREPLSNSETIFGDHFQVTEKDFEDALPFYRANMWLSAIKVMLYVLQQCLVQRHRPILSLLQPLTDKELKQVREILREYEPGRQFTIKKDIDVSQEMFAALEWSRVPWRPASRTQNKTMWNVCARWINKLSWLLISAQKTDKLSPSFIAGRIKSVVMDAPLVNVSDSDSDTDNDSEITTVSERDIDSDSSSVTTSVTVNSDEIPSYSVERVNHTTLDKETGQFVTSPSTMVTSTEYYWVQRPEQKPKMKKRKVIRTFPDDPQSGDTKTIHFHSPSSQMAYTVVHKHQSGSGSTSVTVTSSTSSSSPSSTSTSSTSPSSASPSSASPSSTSASPSSASTSSASPSSASPSAPSSASPSSTSSGSPSSSVSVSSISPV